MTQVHGFLGPIVFVMNVLRVIWTGYRMFTGRALPAERPLTGLYLGLFDLQAFLGLILLATVGTRAVSLLHPVLMLLAAVVAHMGVARGRKPDTPAAVPFALAVISTILVAAAYPSP
ncbi:MAG: hypothetical protein DIU69_09270 [Bacillota bacterium]|nr:MAG: hypothetical protein DIU69_09270 [Bacillota bacterium]